MNKFGIIKQQSDEANEVIQADIKDEEDLEIANEAFDLVASVVLKALWAFRISSEFKNLEQIEQEIVYGMIQEYETVLSYTEENHEDEA